jgi:hypothetical protein
MPLETTPPADATPPTETTEDDLFGPATDATTPPADPSGTAPSEPATPDTNIDDLFGPAATDPAEGAATPAGADSTLPAGETTPAGGDEGTEAAGEDIFNSMYDVLREPGGLASNELRTWVDNTGNYSCRGRLIRFLDNNVRLLKENGRTTTVSLTRLSAQDLQFVHRQASAQQLEAAGQLAQSLSTMQLLAY